MHLQESTLFDLDPNLDFFGRGQPLRCPVPPHHMIYAPAKFEFATSNGLEDMHLQEEEKTVFDIDPRSRSQKLLPSTNYIMLSMHLQFLKKLRPTVEEDKKKLAFDHDHMNYCPVPSTPCDLCTYKV